MASTGLTERVTSEQKLKGSKGVSCMHITGKMLQAEVNGNPPTHTFCVFLVGQKASRSVWLAWNESCREQEVMKARSVELCKP